jgi:hypothetical protein
MGDNRPNVYEDNGVWVYRASSLGNCVKALTAARLGYEAFPHPDWLLKKFEEGNTAEPILIDRFLSYHPGKWWMLDPNNPQAYEDYPYVKHVNVHDDQFTCQIPVGLTAVIRGHMDGIATNHDNELFVVECKAFAASYWDKYMKQGIEAFPYYATQLSLYMHATGLPGMFVMGHKNADGIMNDDCEVHVDRFDTPPISLGAIKTRVAKIENIAKTGELPMCDQNQYPCQYVYLHDDQPEEEDVLELQDRDLDRFADMYEKACAMEKEAKQMKDVAKAGIQATFDILGRKGGKVRTADYNIQDYVSERDARTVEYKASTVRYPKISRNDSNN